jgi:hypothetical protein
MSTADTGFSMRSRGWNTPHKSPLVEVRYLENNQPTDRFRGPFVSQKERSLRSFWSILCDIIQ